MKKKRLALICVHNNLGVARVTKAVSEAGKHSLLVLGDRTSEVLRSHGVKHRIVDRKTLLSLDGRKMRPDLLIMDSLLREKRLGNSGRKWAKEFAVWILAVLNDKALRVEPPEYKLLVRALRSSGLTKDLRQKLMEINRDRLGKSLKKRKSRRRKAKLTVVRDRRAA